MQDHNGGTMTLAEFIAQAREQKELTLRQLQEKADNLDHAYISRLEKGERESPSEAAIEKLAKALQLSNRERQIMSLLAEHEIEDNLYQIMMTRTDLSWDDLEPPATISFRGQRPSSEEDWLRIIDLLKEL
jgi:transcriptional regulator with XRE-family HTH domain